MIEALSNFRAIGVLQALTCDDISAHCLDLKVLFNPWQVTIVYLIIFLSDMKESWAMRVFKVAQIM